MRRARLLRDWHGAKAGDEMDVTPRWLVFAKRQGLAEEVTKTNEKTTANTEPQSEKEE